MELPGPVEQKGEVARAEPVAYPPPLTPWRHAWRLALAGLVSAAQLSSAAPAGGWSPPTVAVDLVLGLAAFALVCCRRRWPLTIALATTALSAVSPLAAGPAVLAAFSLATRRRIPEIALVAATSVTAGMVLRLFYPPLDPDEPWGLTLLVNLVVVLAVLGWGMYVGSRRELVWTLRQRAERAEAEQELRVARARATERSRIAREMHDVLAHRISRISMHAGALAFRGDLTAAELRAGAGDVQDQANAALTDLRDVLGVLREEHSDGLPDRPLPTYADVPALVEEARGSGLRIDFSEELADETSLPDWLGRTVYRIVQEGITNAGKHAPGALLSIEVSGSPADGVDVRLRNRLGFGEPAAPGAGLGLVGLSERADLGGGRLEHRREGSLFVLHGWLPWAA